jgi:hypothetical protein
LIVDFPATFDFPPEGAKKNPWIFHSKLHLVINIDKPSLFHGLIP